MKTYYKFAKSVIPCILLTLCIGFCYAFSLFVPHIAAAIGCSAQAVQFTFCLNIFFLGMGAAMFGPLVESHIKTATTISALLLSGGLLLGGIACQIKSLPLMYLGCGVLCGLSEGCGYVTPNKNMLLWFPASKAKGFLSSVSIVSFGFGSALCSYIFGLLWGSVGISGMFYALSAIYAIPSFGAAFLINKPRYALLKLKKQKKSEFSYISCLKDSFFRKMWLFMFLNISMGLILIGSCASILKEAMLSSQMIILTMMLCGFFNTLGRIVFPSVSDLLKTRKNILISIVLLEVLLMVPCLVWFSAAPFTVVLINATYGAAFATLPSILSSHYGKDTLSQRHGFCLTSWGMASLMAYLCSTFVLSMFSSFHHVMVLVLAGYVVNTFVVWSILKHKKEIEQ